MISEASGRSPSVTSIGKFMLLARGEPLEAAIKGAKAYVTAAIEHAFPLGHGHGPVHHFHQWWQP